MVAVRVIIHVISSVPFEYNPRSEQVLQILAASDELERNLGFHPQLIHDILLVDLVHHLRTGETR